MQTNNKKRYKSGGQGVRRYQDGVCQILQSCYHGLAQIGAKVTMDESDFVDMCSAIIFDKMERDHYGSLLQEEAATLVKKRLARAIINKRDKAEARGESGSPVMEGKLIRICATSAVNEYLRNEGFTSRNNGEAPTKPRRFKASFFVAIVEGDDDDSDTSGLSEDAASLLTWKQVKADKAKDGVPESELRDRENQRKVQELLKKAETQIDSDLFALLRRIVDGESVADAATQKRFTNELPWLRDELEKMLWQ